MRKHELQTVPTLAHSIVGSNLLFDQGPSVEDLDQESWQKARAGVEGERPSEVQQLMHNDEPWGPDSVVCKSKKDLVNHGDSTVSL